MPTHLTSPRTRPALALLPAVLGLLAGHFLGLQPWALLVVAALVVGIAQQTLP
jgi:F0F1-type ATP synthase assembly protein I